MNQGENAIEVTNLTKVFKTKQKEAGFLGSLKSIVKPSIKEITAVSQS